MSNNKGGGGKKKAPQPKKSKDAEELAREDGQKISKILRSVEEVADKILAIKAQLVQLDEQRQNQRMAIRAIEQGKAGDKKVWIVIGRTMVKMEKNKALEILKKDQRVVEIEIQKNRSKQKVLLNKQRDLEHFPPVPGMNLKPFSSQEFAVVRKNLPTEYKSKNELIND